MENNKKSVFETLSTINVSGKTEKKNGLTYLSWAYAWGEVKKLYSSAQYKVYERDTQWGPVNYFTDGRTCWVKVGVTIEGLEYIEMLPVMDYRNKSIALDKITSCDVNKTIQRAITKAIARHGLGLYIYTKEDYPDTVPAQPAQQAQPANKPIEKAQPQAPAQPKAPVKDTRPVTPQMVDFIRKTLEEHQVPTDYIHSKYRVSKLNDLKVYQAKHIGKNINRLKQMFDSEKRERLANVVQNTQPADKKQPQDKKTTFGDYVRHQQPPKQETEGEEITLDLSPSEMEALAECANIFS